MKSSFTGKKVSGEHEGGTMAVKVIGAEKLDRALRELQQACAAPVREFGLAEPLQRDFREMSREQFATGGHGRWPELSPAYAKRKAAKYPGRAIMQQTGETYRELTQAGEGGARVEVTDDTLTFTVDGEVGQRAAAHMKRRGRRPARPPIDPTEKDAERFGNTIRREAVRKAKALGFKSD